MPTPAALTTPPLPEDPSFWFVGATWSNVDQVPRFLKQGVWENGHEKVHLETVCRMRPGERIAIKSSFVQKNDLPFKLEGDKHVSAMRIKAVGTILENLGDGHTVKVAWEKPEAPRDWYFYTYRGTIVGCDPRDSYASKLIDFAFNRKPQDYPYWMSLPYFAEKYKLVEGVVGPPPPPDTGEALAPTTYTASDIVADGCFVPAVRLEEILAEARRKKNVVLQGPPGTGKTWLARRLGFALVGSRGESAQSRIRVVQFHPSLCYEDFVRGYRPSGDGKLALVDGVFLEAVAAARSEPEVPYVLVIEEINRGNPAQVFGELLTLLEADKRHPEHAIELAYGEKGKRSLFVPDNLHVIGTMNLADRSIALVDLALRRRFAFVTLAPTFDGAWRDWCAARGLPTPLIDTIAGRMTALNEQIASDRSLGPQFRVGHSFVTPRKDERVGDGVGWFQRIVEAEVGPLLEEYWYDDEDKARKARQQLLAGL